MVAPNLIEMLSVECISWSLPVIAVFVSVGDVKVLSFPNATSNVSTPPGPVPTPSILT